MKTLFAVFIIVVLLLTYALVFSDEDWMGWSEVKVTLKETAEIYPVPGPKRAVRVEIREPGHYVIKLNGVSVAKRKFHCGEVWETPANMAIPKVVEVEIEFSHPTGIEFLRETLRV